MSRWSGEEQVSKRTSEMTRGRDSSRPKFCDKGMRSSFHALDPWSMAEGWSTDSESNQKYLCRKPYTRSFKGR
jgi:hypothetical protein